MAFDYRGHPELYREALMALAIIVNRGWSNCAAANRSAHPAHLLSGVI
jgi:hypothetical protein